MLDPAAAAGALSAGASIKLGLPHHGEAILDASDVSVSYGAPEGWSGVADRGTQVAIDVRVTEALASEGIARDVVRQVQELRKQSGLEMEDRIILALSAESPKLCHAIDVHRAYICAETLAVEMRPPEMGDHAHRATAKVDGHALTIEFAKASRSS
jgi:isoleucyl-tRNA synthetase